MGAPRTVEVRAVLKRPLRATILAMLALALLPTACTSGPDSGSNTQTILPPASSSPTSGGPTYAANGVSFSYPSDWRDLGGVSTSASMGTQVWSATVGLDGRNLVSVARYTLSVPITAENIETRTDAVRSQLENLFAQAGGSLRAGPQLLRMGGLPALAFAGSAHDPDGRPVEERLVLAFDGTTEYFVNCQYDAHTQPEVVAGCQRIVSTFEVTG
jgi:hypothetical protein